MEGKHCEVLTSVGYHVGGLSGHINQWIYDLDTIWDILVTLYISGYMT